MRKSFVFISFFSRGIMCLWFSGQNKNNFRRLKRFVFAGLFIHQWNKTITRKKPIDALFSKGLAYKINLYLKPGRGNGAFRN